MQCTPVSFPPRIPASSPSPDFFNYRYFDSLAIRFQGEALLSLTGSMAATPFLWPARRRLPKSIHYMCLSLLRSHGEIVPILPSALSSLPLCSKMAEVRCPRLRDRDVETL